MTYLFFDTETTGLPRNYNAPTTDLENWSAARLVQIGWILEDDRRGILSQANIIVRPEGFVIPKEASNVHGITTDVALRDGVSCKYAVYYFLGAARLADILVGHNVPYDKSVVGSELVRQWGKDYIQDMRTVDTMKSSTDFCQIPGARGYKWPKLIELHNKLFGCDFEDAHDAFADISATRKCFWELLKRGIIKL